MRSETQLVHNREGRILPTRCRRRSFVTLSLVVGSLASCGRAKERTEAFQVLTAIEALRAAPNADKRGPLDRLRASPCDVDAICAVKTACVDAFAHHAHGVEIGQRLKSRLDARPDAAANSLEQEPPELAAELLHMNVEIEEGRALMPACEALTAKLRIAYKL